MTFMDIAAVEIAGIPCIASRSGYTGEDGFEISVPADRAVELAETLLDHPSVAPIGLGARDSLRLEAGLCLYGNDIDTTTTPVEAGLTWAIQKVRRTAGDRSGGFPGADRVLRELVDSPSRRRVGLRPEGRAPIRAGTVLHTDEQSEEALGTVTSGVFGPSAEGPVAMGYVPAAQAAAGTRLFAEVRGKRLPVTVAKMPFITPGYKRSTLGRKPC
jgi:aminomethyltransferase